MYNYNYILYPSISSYIQCQSWAPCKKGAGSQMYVYTVYTHEKNTFNDCKVPEYPVDLAINHGLTMVQQLMNQPPKDAV
jgi:hypothetical protein